MAEPFLSDELWVVVEPTIPKHVTSSRGDDRDLTIVKLWPEFCSF